MLSAFLLGAFFLTACASTPEAEDAVDLSPFALSDLVVPDALPEPGGVLGFLRPDATATRDDVTIVVAPYTVGGATPEALLSGEDGLRASAEAAGLSFIARVDWRVTWRPDFDIRDGLCRAEDVSTRLSVTYRLPDWQPDGDVPAGLADYWADFERDLWIHEYGHALIGYRAKQDVQSALSGAKVSDPDCKVVGRALNRLGRAITVRGLDADYDARTGHGRTQGATFEVRAARKAVRRAPDPLPQG